MSYFFCANNHNAFLWTGQQLKVTAELKIKRQKKNGIRRKK